MILLNKHEFKWLPILKTRWVCVSNIWQHLACCQYSHFCVIGGSKHITANVTCQGVKESENIIWLTGSCPQCPLSVGTLSLLLAAKWHHTYLPAVILLVGYCCPSTEIGWGGCHQICQHLFGCFVFWLSGAIFSRYYLLNDTAIWYHWRYWKWIGPEIAKCEF